MLFYVKTGEFQQALKYVSTIVKASSTAFDGLVSFVAQDGVLTCIAFNGKTGISYKLPAIISEEGEFSVVFVKIKSFVMALPPLIDSSGIDGVEVKLVNGKVKLKAIFVSEENNKSINKVSIESEKSYSVPSLGAPSGLPVLLHSKALKKAIDKVIYAIDVKGLVLYTTGINAVFTKDSLNFVTTDGRVLCEYIMSNFSHSIEGIYFLSYDFIAALSRLLATETSVSIYLESNKIYLDLDNLFITSQVKSMDPSCEFPDYKNQFTLFDRTLTLDRSIIIQGLSPMLELLNPEDFNRITLSLDADGIHITSDISSFEFSLDSIDPVLYFSVDIDGRDFMDTLYALDSDAIIIKYLNNENGLILTNVSESQNTYIVNLIPR